MFTSGGVCRQSETLADRQAKRLKWSNIGNEAMERQEGRAVKDNSHRSLSF